MRTNYIIFLEKIANGCETLGVISILALALFFEFALHELPCPLCLLQRVGFYFMTFGFLLNLRFGFRPSHYSIIILGGFYTAFVALRQIALHVIPGSGAYGNPILGFHLYTWSFIITMIITIVTTILFGIDRQYNSILQKDKSSFFSNSLFTLVTITLIINIISVVLECGFAICPDNPVNFRY